jgi:putative transposase
MSRAGIAGVSGRPRFRRIPNVATAGDLVERRFGRDEPDRLWVTDITEHPTREGKVYCAVVLDVFSRRVVGWSIDATQTAALVTNALGMAIEGRRPTGPSSTPIRAPSSRPRRSPDGHSTRASCPRWARSGVASTTR